MNQAAFERICEILESNGIEYKVLSHPPCRSSAESAQARSQAGFPEAIGAKALLTRMLFLDNHSEFNLLVLPGPARLCSRALKDQIPQLKKFRFASPDDLFDLCGVVPGALPPFGSMVFPKIDRLFIDQGLAEIQVIGFNAADLQQSIVMRATDYLCIANADSVFKLTE